MLRGDFGRVFESEAVHFNAAEGTLRIDHSPKASAAVQGDDLTAKWTRRALETLGYRVVDWGSAADLRVVRRANGSESYEVHHNEVVINALTALPRSVAVDPCALKSPVGTGKRHPGPSI